MNDSTRCPHGNEWDYCRHCKSEEAQKRQLTEEHQRCLDWEKRAKEHEAEALYYQQQLVDAHALLGRVIHQLSERWDTVNVTKYFPTDNLHGFRRVGNAQGENHVAGRAG